MGEKTFSVAEAKKHFSEIIGKVAYGKEQILITKRGRPMARLVPVVHSEMHLGDVKGWLEEDDPFFGTVNRIIKNRKSHTPRVLKGHPQKYCICSTRTFSASW